MTNPMLELLISLGVDDSSTKANIKRYIDQLKNLPSIEVQLDVNGVNGAQKGFNSLEKQVESLQSQVKSLKQEMKGFDGSINPKGIESFKSEIGSSIKSITDLEKAVKHLNGQMTLNFGKVTGIDGNKDEILKSVSATMKDVDGLVKSFTFKPMLDSQGFLVGIEEINKKVTNLDFKNFDAKAEKTSQLIRELGRQGHISADQLGEYKTKIDTLKTNKSVDELSKLETQLKSLNKEASDNNRMDNSMVNMERQARGLLETVNKLKSTGNIDGSQLNKLANDIERIGTTNITNLNQVDKLNLDFKDVEATVNSLVKKSSELSKINTAIESISPTVDRLNDKLTTTVNKLGSNINTEALTKIKNEIIAISNTDIKTTDQIANLNNHISQTEKSITQLTVSANHMSRFESTFEKASNALRDLERSGYSTEDTILSLRNKLSNIPVGDLDKVKNVISLIDKEMDKISHQNGITKAISNASLELGKLEAQLEKTKALYARSFDKNVAEQLNGRIVELRNNLDNISGKGFDNIKQADLDGINNNIKQMSVGIKQFNADATTSVRNSIGVFESLKIALEKFPVWMLASTLFYSTARGISDLTEKVIELDTAMTNMRRVMDLPDHKFNEILTQSIVNVTELSGKLGDYLELVSEFGRMGFSDVESLDLSNTAQALTNISDLQASESVSSLMAAMIAFNIEAEKSIKIADVLNEVDNTYSITTKDLSQSLNKAASTANTFGVELEELVGHTTAIGAATRESGNIVG